MRIAVTGSSGFIGSNLVPVLKENGFDVLEVSRAQGLDICDWEQVKELPACDIVIHLAARTYVPDSFDNPRDFYNVNFSATINALELARKWKAKVIYMSSYFYGPPQYLPVDEQHGLHPHNPYAETKLISEELCKAYHRDFDISCTAFRLFNIYGPGQTGMLLLPTILDQVKTGRVVLKDPRPKRDYIHVNDVVDAVITEIESRNEGFDIYNLGYGQSYSVKELVDTLQSFDELSFDVEYTNEFRKGEVLDSVADISKIKNKLGWMPKTDLKAGLKTLI